MKKPAIVMDYHRSFGNFEKTYQLWDELSDFGVQQTDEALDHCLGTLCKWLCADNAFWVGTVRVVQGATAARDPMSGWRIRTVHELASPEQGRVLPGKVIRSVDNEIPPETNCALAAQAGNFRLYTLLDGNLVDVATFKRTEHYEYYYRQRGITDRLWVVFPVNSDVESFFCFDKHGKRSRFSKSEQGLAGQTLRGIKWFHRQVIMSHGLGMSESPITPTDRKILRCLLSGTSEKEIAKDLSLTHGSAHQYITTIFRKFGVRGRANFMSLWLQRRC